MNIYKIFLIIILFSGQSLLAGNLPTKVLPLPAKYKMPKVSTGKQLGKTSDIIPGSIWEVYSDRSGNKTVTAVGGSSMKTLSYLEMFYVVEESESHLHIIKDPKLDYKGNVSSEAEDFGWIEKTGSFTL